MWSADGSELFYRDGTAVMAIDVSIEDGTVSLGTPRQLFDGNYRASNFTREYHVGPDGRFLMLKETPGGDDENPAQIMFTTGGILYGVSSLSYLLAILMLQAEPMWHHLVRGSVPTPMLMARTVAVVLLSAFVTFAPLSYGSRRLSRLEL